MLRDYPWPAVDVRDVLGKDYKYKFDCEVVRTAEGWRPASTAMPLALTEGTHQRKENTDSNSRYIASRVNCQPSVFIQGFIVLVAIHFF